jgi:hypothetical protein
MEITNDIWSEVLKYLSIVDRYRIATTCKSFKMLVDRIDIKDEVFFGTCRDLGERDSWRFYTLWVDHTIYPILTDQKPKDFDDYHILLKHYDQLLLFYHKDGREGCGRVREARYLEYLNTLTKSILTGTFSKEMNNYSITYASACEFGCGVCSRMIRRKPNELRCESFLVPPRKYMLKFQDLSRENSVRDEVVRMYDDSSPCSLLSDVIFFVVAVLIAIAVSSCNALFLQRMFFKTL